MYKKVAGLVLAVILTMSSLYAQSGKSITVKGKVKFPDPTGKYKIYLGQYKGDGFNSAFKAMDSVALKPDNTFSFTIKTDKPDFYIVRVYYMDQIEFWADKENVSMSFRGIDTAKMIVKNPPYIFIEGSPENDVVNHVNFAFHRNYQNMILLYNQLYKAEQVAKDSIWTVHAKILTDSLSTDFSSRIKLLAKMYQNSPAVLYALRYLRWERDGDLMMNALDNLAKKYPKLPQIKKQKADLLADIAQTKKIANGMPAPEFAYSDLNGKKWGPKDFKGKYLIIDFWASWCGPCRQEIPHLKEVYKKYKDKGLDILAVSIDAKVNDWKKALNEEKMPWTQAHAPESKPVMSSYLFSGIPYLVLVDKEGRIIEKNLRGESLDEKLKEIFGI
ncbi:TlpA disulfide reductase family protein [Pedobacter nyackensis]|uniref:Thiol-disulfide isomerase or thioredoxin n=1 Tax=Pedobacter nyackensis TaxID=475255 RepID=A0A1W2E1E6_9SPHI|nr:TlpA disulfide reductase family protein [Pedobacter nyackensis]SMD02878.1 Thiol-disulfide isomerase or thioredoxin [Pedobacter nyackensis]